MPSESSTPVDPAIRSDSKYPFDDGSQQLEGINIREIFLRINGGAAQTLGLLVIGAALGAALYVLSGRFGTCSTSVRVAFAFNGYANGEYPDRSKFQADDLRAPDIISTALKRDGFGDDEKLAGSVRAGLTVEGIIPPNVVKERDRLRAAGQVLATYLPDEYLLTLTLPRRGVLSDRQREILLTDIVTEYHEKFDRTYADLPAAFGNAFASLKNADFFEYELILNQEMQNITSYLDRQENEAKSFRSSTTNLSFSDLRMQAALFSQIRLSETLGLIRQNGLSSNRTIAMVKMDYYLHTLEDQEERAVEQAKVIDDLLVKTEQRSDNYVLGIKSTATEQRPNTPVLDQGLIDSLLANDAYNFLVHKALDAGLVEKSIEADKTQLLERRKSMEEFLSSDSKDQSLVVGQVEKSLSGLEGAYMDLVSSIRKTQSDYAHQQYADAIRISMQATSADIYRPGIVASILGGVIGLALGVGLSLLGFRLGRGRT